jgi:hypothetical protein
MNRPTLEWVGPDGNTWYLSSWEPSSASVTAMDEVSGISSTAPVEIVADDSPNGGTTIRTIWAGNRIAVIPLLIDGSTHDDYMRVERGMGESLASTRRLGPGTLRVVRPNGSVRQIRAVYSEGWDPEAFGSTTSATVVVSLYCESPWWRAESPTLLVSAYGSASGDFLNPFPTISSSTALGSTTATNSGSVEAWPDWVITGPASLVTIANTTRSESFTIDPNADGIDWGDLQAGQIVSVHTNPVRIIGPDGSPWTAALNWPTAKPWQLDPGVSNIEVSAVGAAAGTRIVGSFYAQYETA